jgi:DNA-binding MarR family transcriptional regulator
MPTSVQRLGQSLKRAQWRDHRALDSALRAAGTTLVQWDALRAVDARPGASGHELAAATFMSDQAFATLASRLLRAGLVERSPGGGRRHDHRLTAEGRRVLAVGEQIVDETLAALFAPLDAAERQHLQLLLDALVGRSG